jgi:hypothetical protein
MITSIISRDVKKYLITTSDEGKIIMKPNIVSKISSYILMKSWIKLKSNDFLGVSIMLQNIF